MNGFFGTNLKINSFHMVISLVIIELVLPAKINMSFSFGGINTISMRMP